MEDIIQEILAENLEDFFNNTKLEGKRTYKGNDYECGKFQMKCLNLCAI